MNRVRVVKKRKKKKKKGNWWWKELTSEWFKLFYSVACMKKKGCTVEKKHEP